MFTETEELAKLGSQALREGHWVGGRVAIARDRANAFFNPAAKQVDQFIFEVLITNVEERLGAHFLGDPLGDETKLKRVVSDASKNDASVSA